MPNRSKELAQGYFRLNGFLTLPNFVLHPSVELEGGFEVSEISRSSNNRGDNSRCCTVAAQRLGKYPGSSSSLPVLPANERI
jgi:hypothetical protein